MGAAALVLALGARTRVLAEAGRTAAGTLKIPLSARAIAMGESFSAVDGAVASMGYNPAGSARTKRPVIETTYAQGIIDDHFSFIGYAHPLSYGVLTVGAIYYDAGKIKVSLSNGEESTRNAQQDAVAMAGLSLPIGAGFDVGGLFKAFRLTVADTARTGSAAGDAGVLWHTPLPGLNLGASIQNIGPDVKFEQEGDPLPLTTRFGAAYLLDLERYGAIKDISYAFNQFLFTAEGVQVRNEGFSPRAGLEMGMPLGESGRGALRFGYLFNRDLDSLTVGIGFKEKRFFFDYALGVKRAIKNVHNFSLGVQF